jgi:hypothetical protein
MASSHRIQIRSDKGKYIANLHSLGNILVGKDSRFNSFREKFWGIYAREMFRRISKSYMDRSLGKTDDLGNAWLPLKEKTIKRKKRYHWRGGDTGDPKKVPPARYPRRINMDQLELYKSLAMGSLGARYNPNPGQKYDVNVSEVVVGTEVPIAKFVDRKRVIIPKNVQKWVAESLAVAVDKTATMLADLKG